MRTRKTYKPKAPAYRKRRSIKRRKTKSKPRTVSLGKTLPDRIRVKLTDSWAGQISTTNSDTYFEVALNGMYDPDITSTGGQPQGFDQYAAMYKYYRVIASSISIYYFNTDNAYITQISIIPHYKRDDTIRTYTNPEQLKHCKFKRFANESGGGGKSTGTLSHYMTVSKLVGNRLMTKNDDTFGAAVEANPGSAGLCYWYVLFQEPITGTGELQGDYIVTVNYYAEFYGARILADS